MSIMYNWHNVIFGMSMILTTVLEDLGPNERLITE